MIKSSGNMDKQEQIISKIKKLLAMTELNGCSPEEAAVAVAHAQLLMAKYDIQVTELSEQEKAIIEDKFNVGTKSISKYQSLLAGALAPHFAVRVIICIRSSQSYLNIIGDKMRAAIFKEVYLFAYKAFQQQWTAYHKSMDITMEQKNNMRDSYFRGFLSGFEQELQRSENANALVIREDPEIETYVREHFPHLVKNNSIRLRGWDDKAYSQGLADGKFAQQNKNKSIQEMEDAV